MRVVRVAEARPPKTMFFATLENDDDYSVEIGVYEPELITPLKKLAVEGAVCSFFRLFIFACLDCFPGKMRGREEKFSTQSHEGIVCIEIRS